MRSAIFFQVPTISQSFAIFRNFPAISLTCPSCVAAGVVRGHRSVLLRSVPIVLLLLTVSQSPCPAIFRIFQHFFRDWIRLPPSQTAIPPPPPCPGEGPANITLHVSPSCTEYIVI